MKTIKLGTPCCGAVRVFRGVMGRDAWDDSAIHEEDIERLEMFQRAHDLTPDGICGPLTWVRLLVRNIAAAGLVNAYWPRIQQLLWLDGFIQDAKWPIADRDVRKLPESQRNILPLADTVVAGRRYAAATCGGWGAFVSGTVMGGCFGFMAATGNNWRTVSGNTVNPKCGNTIARMVGECTVRDSKGRKYPAFGLADKCEVWSGNNGKMTEFTTPGLWLLQFAPGHVGMVVVPDPAYPISDRDGNPITEPLDWASGENKVGGLHTMKPVSKCNVNADSRRVLSAAWWDPSKVNVDAPPLRLEG